MHWFWLSFGFCFVLKYAGVDRGRGKHQRTQPAQALHQQYSAAGVGEKGAGLNPPHLALRRAFVPAVVCTSKVLSVTKGLTGSVQ